MKFCNIVATGRDDCGLTYFWKLQSVTKKLSFTYGVAMGNGRDVDRY